MTFLASPAASYVNGTILTVGSCALPSVRRLTLDDDRRRGLLFAQVNVLESAPATSRQES